MTGSELFEELIERLRSERDPAVPPLATATSIIMESQDRLDELDRKILVFEGAQALPPGSRLSLDAGANFLFAWSIGGQDWKSLPTGDLTTLMASGLVALERSRAELAAHLAAGTLTRDEYVFLYRAPDQGQEVGFFGWIPGCVAAPIAAVIVALVAWNLWLFPVVAVGGAILGFVATAVVYLVFLYADERWQLLGPRSQTVSGYIFLGMGPVVVVLIALVALWLV